ncbi:hypothetical protein NNC19_10625 [Clostridium sp. SHJSY1]|uniref:hypothetical protein n=1 Tax=Clostridium sp. SHJSY1 TaxID=2942483 RepID=UPI00287656ED|nr:hypothetical protein [Clostridium sp. SHJSY1]MDS0526136.1 hypothetical protein [Clostridium sp. SHJSY1]
MDNKVSILGIDFSKLNLKETVDLIDRRISGYNNKTFHLITVNPEIAIQIREDKELKKYPNVNTTFEKRKTEKIKDFCL